MKELIKFDFWGYEDLDDRMTIERLCTTCHKRVKPGSKLKIYCQGHKKG